MSTTNGNMKSLKVTDKNGNVYILLPVDTDARQAIEDAKNLQFDEDYFTAEETNTEVNIGLNGVPFGVNNDTPLEIVQDDQNGLVLGVDSPFNQAIAPIYSASSTYSEDDIVIYKSKLYSCNTNISTAEAWNSSHWTEIAVIDYVNSAIAGIDFTPYITETNLGNIVARLYDNSVSYTVGQYVIHNKTLYKCKTDTTGSWDGTKWEAITVSSVLEGIKPLDAGDGITITEASNKVIVKAETKMYEPDIVIDPNEHTGTFEIPLNKYSILDGITSDVDELIIIVPPPTPNILQQTAFEFELPEVSGQIVSINSLKVLCGSTQLPIIGPPIYTSGEIYQGSVVNNLVVIAEYDKVQQP